VGLYKCSPGFAVTPDVGIDDVDADHWVYK